MSWVVIVVAGWVVVAVAVALLIGRAIRIADRKVAEATELPNFAVDDESRPAAGHPHRRTSSASRGRPRGRPAR